MKKITSMYYGRRTNFILYMPNYSCTVFKCGWRKRRISVCEWSTLGNVVRSLFFGVYLRLTRGGSCRQSPSFVREFVYHAFRDARRHTKEQKTVARPAGLSLRDDHAVPSVVRKVGTLNSSACARLI